MASDTTQNDFSTGGTQGTGAGSTSGRPEHDLEVQIAKLREDVRDMSETLKSMAGSGAESARQQAFALRDDLRHRGEAYMQQAQDAASELEEEMSDRIRSEPIKSVLIAAGGRLPLRAHLPLIMVAQLLTKLITGEAGVYLARMKRLALLYAMLAVLALMIGFFLLLALYIYLSSLWGWVYTALGFAGAFFVLMIIVGIAVLIVRRPPRKRADDHLQRDIASIAGVAAVSNLPVIFGAVRKHKSLLAVPVVGAAGFAAWRAIQRYRNPDL